MTTIRPLMAILFLVMQCADRISPNDSRYDPDFGGDNYHFRIDLPPVHDTLNVFDSLKFSCRLINGSDSLKSYRYSFEPAGSIDAVPLTTTGFFAPATIYFKDTCSKGILSVTAIRPNGEEIPQYDTITIVNPFRITAITGWLGSGLNCIGSMTNSRDSTAAPAIALNTIWFLDGKPVDTLDFNAPCSVKVRPDDSIAIIGATLIGTNPAYRFRVPEILMHIPKSGLPRVTIKDTIVNVPAGILQAILVDSTPYADSLVWIHHNNDTTVLPVTVEFKSTWNDTASFDTVIVMAKNRFGTCGTKDTVYVKAGNYDYLLDDIVGPSVITGRTWQVWTVFARGKDRERLSDDSIDYNWSFSDSTCVDSSRSRDGTLELKCSSDNDIASFKLSVFAFRGSDTSLKRQRIITLLANRPTLTLTSFDTAADIRDTAVFTVATADTGAGGGVKAAYYRIGDGSVQQIAGDTVKIPCTTAGLLTIKFWCVDNVDFVSDTQTVTLPVISPDPYFTNQTTAITTYIGDSVRIGAPAERGTSNKGSAINKWTWDFDADGSVERTTDIDRIDTLFTTPGKRIIKVGCTNMQGIAADPSAQITINVSEGTPLVRLITCSDTGAYLHDTVSVRIVASDTNGTIRKIDLFRIGTDTFRISLTPGPAKDIDTMLKISMPDSGVFHFAALATDDDNLTSLPQNQADSIIIRAGRPTLSRVSPDTCWIIDSTTYTIDPARVHGSVDSVRIQWDPVGVWQTSNSLQLYHSYHTPGLKKLRVVAFDHRGLSGDTLTDSIVVKLGKPSVTSLTFSDSVWINDSTTCIVKAGDPNPDGTITSRWIRWADNSSFVNVADTTGHRYGTDGPYRISAYVLDDDSVSSDTVHKNVVVRRGAPSILSVAVQDPGYNAIYFNDSIKFTVVTKDTNDAALTTRAAWNGDVSFTAEQSTVADTLFFYHVFGSEKIGTDTVRFRVADQDGNFTDALIPVQVLRGESAVSILGITPTIGNIFVRDTVKINVRATDVNGTIKKIFVNWQGGSVPQDSITCSGDSSGISTVFQHPYNDTTGGNKTVRLWTIDNDMVSSGLRDTAIFIRKGAPRIWGDTGDTLWVVVDNGVGINKHYPVKPNHYDTNGTIVRYYWNSSNTLTGATITTTDTIMPPFTSLTPFDLYIFGRDDDSLIGGGKFVVFPDSAPREPVLGSVTTVGDSVKLVWQNSDTKDGDSTKFQILCDGVSPPTAIARTYATCQRVGSEYFYWYHPSATGSYFWKVQARDARGSISSSSGNPYFSFTK